MQITDAIHAIHIPFQVRVDSGVTVDRFVYVYLVYGKEICLIDTGVVGSELTIFDYIRKTGRKPDEISVVILTHSHPDHIGAARPIVEETDCIIAAHPTEKTWIEDVALQSMERTVPGFHSLVAGSVSVDRTLEDGDILNLGDNSRLAVFHTPGHSKGSISLFLLGDRALFSGDAIPLKGDVPIYEDVLASVRSIKRLRSIGDINYLLASWDDPRHGDQVYKVMDEGLRYLQHVHETVIKTAGNDCSQMSLELCERVLAELELHQMVANPLVAKSFEASLRAGHHPNLLLE